MKKAAVIAYILLWFIFIVVSAYAQETEPEWSGEVATSFASASGNTDTQAINGSAKVKRTTNSHEVLFEVEALYGTEGDNIIAEYYLAGLKDLHFLEANTGLYWLQQLSGAQNKPAGIGARLEIFLGVGYRLKGNKYSLALELGPGGIYEERTDNSVFAETAGKGYAEGVYRFETATLTVKAEYLCPLKEQDDYRALGSAHIGFPIWKGFSLRTGIKVEYVNIPPIGAEQTDVYTSTALVWSFK